MFGFRVQGIGFRDLGIQGFMGLRVLGLGVLG
jgi:hypothetical protein